MELPLMPSRRQTDSSICGRMKRYFTGVGAFLFGKCFPCCFSSLESSFSDDDTFSDSSTEFQKPAERLLPPDLCLLCSYGGRFNGDQMYGPIPTYRGGENRIITVDRHCSAAELFHRLSTSLLGGRSFTLKYQLSVQGYTSLITVVNDEDLKFLIEEYDRISNNFLPPMPPMPQFPKGKPLPVKAPRSVSQRRFLRVFLFPKEAAEDATGILIGPTAQDSETSDFDDDSFDDDDYDDNDEEAVKPVQRGLPKNNGSLQKPVINPPSSFPTAQMKKKPGGSPSKSKK